MIPPVVADFWLQWKIKDVEQQTAALPWFEKLDSVRQSLIVCLIYNMGFHTFIGFTKMIAALEVADYTTAAAELKDSDWYKELDPHPEWGTERGDRYVRILETGVWES